MKASATLLSCLALCWTQIAFAQVDVTATVGAPASYTTLTGAFAAINLGTHQGVIGIALTGDTTETAPAVLNASGSGAAVYTAITISPSGGAARTISGAIAAGSPLIDLNGADNVTINGLNSGGNTLTIANTTVSATASTSTVRFIGGATNNTITNANVQGSGTMNVPNNGAVIFFSTDALTANGNDNNTISNSNIGPAGSNLPTKGILGNGSTTTTAIGNSGNIINNNNIFDYFGAAVTSAGVATNGGCNTWSITNNRFYQTGTRTWTTGALHNAINIANNTATGGAQGFTITGNTIGFASNTQTGTYTLTGLTGKFIGIVFTGITGGAVSNINSNTIASVSMTGVTSSGTGTTSPFMGILVTNGLANTNNNTIGSQSANGSLTFSTNSTTATEVYGIYNVSTNNWAASGNNIGGISVTNAAASGTYTLYGMRANTGTGLTFNGTLNNVGGTVANSIQLNATGVASQVIGMHTSNATANLSLNTIRNLSTNIGTGTATSASVIGINVTTATPNHTLSQNTISNLSNSHVSAASVVTGIQFTGGGSNVVERNMISGLGVATNSTTAEVNGIRVADGTTIYRNNVIAIGAGIANAIGTGSTTGGVNGINEPGGTNSFFHNSVFIGGAPTAGVGPSFAFNSSITTNPRSFRNNIFFNARSNSGATGKNYAVRVGGTTPNPAGLTMNNNVYFANGTGAVFGFYNAFDVANLAAWQAAVGQDANSFEANPMYVSSTDLHLQAGSPAIDQAANVGVPNDFEGDTRPGANATFDIGADERDGTPTGPLAGTYTVGTGGNYLSLTNSGGIFDAINNQGASANLTINIISDLSGEQGTYALNEIAGGFTVLLKPSGAARAITGSNTGALIRFNGADGVTIDGSTTSATATGIGGNAAIRELTIQNTNVVTSAGVVSFGSGVNGAQNDTIRNVNILGQDPLTTFVGISLGGTTPGTVGTDNDNNRVENCSVRRVRIGIYSAGLILANQNTGTVIRMNETSALTGDRIRRVGIMVFNEAGIQITENSINGVSTNESQDGIGIAVGTQSVNTTNITAGGVTGALVSRNKIDGVASLATFSAAGIAVAGAAGTTNVLQNNMISGVTANATSTDIVAGIYVQGVVGSSTRLLYNSVSMSGDRGAQSNQTPSYGVAITGTDPTVELKNNAFATTQIASGGGVNAESYAIGMVTTTFANLDANFNDYFSSGANAGFFRSGSLNAAAGTDYATLALWATAVADDANSLQVDPQFLSVSDLHIPMASPLVAAGTPVPGVTVDFDNEARPATTPEIGADEFSALSNTAPTISDITNQSTNEDTATGAIVFTVGDVETPVGSLTVSGASSNTALIPNANLVFGGSGASRMLTITPAANLSGASTITVTVNDGTSTTSDTFVLTVNAVNDLPSFTGGASQSPATGTNTAQTVVAWATAINDGDADFVQALTFNVSNTNNGLFTVQPTVNSTTGTLSYTPNGSSGSATVSVSLTDDTSAGGPALTSAMQTFTISVGAAIGGLQVGTVTLPATMVGVNPLATVTFAQAFNAIPVVIVQPTDEDADPQALRIRNVTATGFQVLQVEPPGCAGCTGSGGTMTVHWLAAVPGSYRLRQDTTVAPAWALTPQRGSGPGALLKVGTLTTTATQFDSNSNGGFGTWPLASWASVSWPMLDGGLNFASAPVLLTSIQSWNNEGPNLSGSGLVGSSQPWATSVANNVTTTGFDVAIEASGVSVDDLAPAGFALGESIGYVALEGNVSELLLPLSGPPHVGLVSGSAAVTNGGCSTLNQSFPAATPINAANFRAFAGKQTRTTSQGGWLRRCLLTNPSGTMVSVGMRVAEQLASAQPAALPEGGSDTMGVTAFSGDLLTTPVTLAKMVVQRQGAGLLVRWSTSTEVGQLGFRLWGRAGASGTWELLTPNVLSSAAEESRAARFYEHSVAVAGALTEVRIEDVDVLGASRFHPAVAVGSSRGEDPVEAPINWTAIRSSNAQTPAARSGTVLPTLLAQVNMDGVQRVAVADLIAQDARFNGQPASSLAVLDGAAPIPRYVSCAQLQAGCTIEFLGVARSSRYGAENAYTLTLDADKARAVRSGHAVTGTGSARVYTDSLVNYPNRSFNSSGPVDDPWVDERVLASSGLAQIQRSFTLPERVPGPVQLTVDLWGALDFPDLPPDHHVQILLNEQLLAERTFDGLTGARIEVAVPESLLTSSNTLTLRLPRDTGYSFDAVMLEGFKLSYPRRTRVSGGALAQGSIDPTATNVGSAEFRDGFETPASVSSFQIDGQANAAVLWSVINGELRRDELGTAAVLLPATSTAWRLADVSALRTPALSLPANAYTLPAQLDYLVITNPQFESGLAPLLALQASRGLSTAVLRTDAIYATHSDHVRDPQAIKAAIAAAKQRGARFVLLVGGDSVDYHNYLGSGSQSYLPTWYTPTNRFIFHAASDHPYADVSGDERPELAIGRLPVRTSEELTRAITSIIARGNSVAQRYLAVAGASQPGEHFALHSRAILGYLRQPGQQRSYALVDEVGTASAKALAREGLAGSADWLSYLGHSSPSRWAFDNLLDVSQLASITRTGAPAIVSQWSCWNNDFTAPTQNTMAHALMLRENRLAAAVLGATSLAEDASHLALATRFFDLVENGRIGDRGGLPITTLGEALQAAKADLLEHEPAHRNAAYTIVLFGDPAAPLQP